VPVRVSEVTCSRSILAALFSDGFLADALERRLWDNVLLLEDGRGRHVQPDGS
jgi:hypothetical protein